MKQKIKILFIAFSGIILNSVAIAQQIELKGVVTVQNSKTNTGKIQNVRNAEVIHINNNVQTKDVTGNDGKFSLNIRGVAANTQIKIETTLHGEYADYVVVNTREIQDITLGRITPINIFITKKGELEKRRSEMVGINMRKLEERADRDKARLQKELNELRANNDYLNERYSVVRDSLNIISNNIDAAFERIKEYAQTMTLENLDDREENYVKAYNFFANGELDSVIHYLRSEEMELQHQRVLQQQQDAAKKLELAKILTEAAQLEIENARNSLNELIRGWQLLAKTYAMKFDYNNAKMYFEKVINADTTNADNIFEYGYYLSGIFDHSGAEKYYRKSLPLFRVLAQENPEVYSFKLLAVLSGIGVALNYLQRPSNAITYLEESLKLGREMLQLKGYTEEYYQSISHKTLNILYHLGFAFERIDEYNSALQNYKYVLENYKNVNPTIATQQYMIYTLSSLARLFSTHTVPFKNLAEALSYSEMALKYSRELAKEDAKQIIFVAWSLNSLGDIFRTYSAEKEEYWEKGLAYYEEALKIRRELAIENPKAHLMFVAHIIANIGKSYQQVKKYSIAKQKYEEALKIYREIAIDNSGFLPYLANELMNFSDLHFYTKEYAKAEQYAREVLEIKHHNIALQVISQFHIANSLLFQGNFSGAEKLYKEAMQQEDKKSVKYSIRHILTNFEKYEEAGIISETVKSDVAKIKKMLENELEK